MFKIKIQKNLKNRKREIYTMQWQNMDFQKFVIAAAPFGGAIGKKLKNKIQSHTMKKKKLLIDVIIAK